MLQIERELNSILAKSPIQLRRWFVDSVILSQENRDTLEGISPPSELVEIARGNAPSPEHAGIAARLIYDYLGHKKTILNLMPTLEDPKSWNQGEYVWHLIMWLYRPWEQMRYDPRSETLAVILPNKQWAFHLKGKDTEQAIVRYLTNTLRGIKDFGGFSAVVTAMSDNGWLSLDPRDSPLSSEDFAKTFSLCEAAFTKFLSRSSAMKELIDACTREPMMMFDTSTINCMTGLAAFGNGVVPTDDIYDRDPEDLRAPILTIPAGRLIEADREFMLGSAAGLEWPDDDYFDGYVQFRADIENGMSENSWEDWQMGSRILMQQILDKHCKTYRDFLDYAFPADPTPVERDAFLRLLGAAVFGSNLKLVAAMIGAPNAGKDTVIKWLTYLLGSDLVGVLSPMALTAQADDQRAFAPLKGAKLAVVSGEVGEGRNTAILAEKVKSITSGGGTLTVAEKYEKPTTIFFDGMLIMQGNSVPTIIGGDQALYKNRLVAVEFKHPFPLQANSFEREYRREAPYFLQVLFLAYCDYIERGGGMVGIDPPASWRAFGEEVQASADQLAMIERCIKLAPDTEIPSSVFYKALSIMAEKHFGYRYPMSSMKWAARLKKAGIQIIKDKNTEHRTKVNRGDYKGWMFHLTLDADQSDGYFSEQDWQNALNIASMSLTN